MKKIVFLTFIILSVQNFAQGVKIAPTVGNPDPSAGLEVDYPDKGILIPRIQLTDVNDVVTVPSPVQSLLVFNIGAAGAGNDTVYEGYYYWSSDSTKWLRMSSSGSDDQNIDSVTINGTTITVYIEDGNSASANLIGIANDSLFYTTIANNLVTNDTTLKWLRDSVNILTSLTNTDSTISYVDENGDTTLIDVQAMVDSVETVTEVFNTDSTISYVDENRDTTVLDVKAMVDSVETVTEIFNTDSTISYVDENGDTTVIDVQAMVDSVETVTEIFNTDSTISYVDENGDTTVIDVQAMVDSVETVTEVFNTDSTISYVDENGDTTLLDVKAMVDSVETVTFVSQIGDSSFSYVNEDGVIDTVDLSGLRDRDWFNINTNLAPANITDTIYTMGNVGIGTNSPLASLNVQGGNARVGNDTSFISLRYSDITGTNTGIEMRNANSGTSGGLWLDNLAKMHLGQPTISNQLTIDLITHDIGLGTTTPTNRLDVNGQARIRTINDTTDISNILTSNINGVVQKLPYDSIVNSLRDSIEDHDFYNVNTNAAPTSINDTIYTNGYVGIGTNNPNWMLETSGANSDASFNGVRVGRGNNDLVNNTAIGNFALDSITTGNANTGLGFRSLNNTTSGVNNTGVGAGALRMNDIGANNVALGAGALTSNVSGGNNVALGYASLSNNLSAGANISIGSFAMQGNTSGVDNVAIGYVALRSNQSGNNNIAIGHSTLMSNNGNGNTIIGRSGARNTTTANFNTIVGFNSGGFLRQGSNNTFIGAQIGSAAADSSLSNTIIIADGSGNQRIRVNNIGDVGLGITTPTHRLDVNGEARIRTINDTTDISNILTSNINGIVQKLPYDSIVNSLRDSIEDHDFYNVNTNAAPTSINDTIYTMGRVGVGTNNPQGKFQVSLDQNGTIDSTFILTDNGRVGIGTETPDARLHIEGINMTEARIIINNVGPPANGSVLSFESQGVEMAQVTGNTGDGINGNLLFYTANGGVSAEKMRLDSLGYLAIGSTNPTHRLDVNGEARIRTINDTTDISNILTSNINGTVQKLPYDSIVNSLRDSIEDHDWYSRVTNEPPTSNSEDIFTLGNVTIGANSTTDRLSVRGGNIALDSNMNGNFGFITQADGNGIGLASSLTTVDKPGIHVAGNGSNWGRVGVGTLNPTGRFQITTDFDGTIDSTLTVLESGSVGIGTEAPLYIFHVEDNQSDLIAGNNYSSYTRTTFAPAAAATGANFADLDYLIQSGANNSQLIGGGYHLAQHNGGGVATQMWGAYNRADNLSIGTVSNQIGGYNLSTNNPGATGDITFNHGAYNFGQNNSPTATIENNYGAVNLSENLNTGNITEAYGSHNQVDNESTGIISAAYGISIGIFNNGAGSIDTGYGVFINDVGATMQYGIYQGGANDTNYFNGYTGIGTDSPAEKLEVVGNILASGTIVSSDRRYKRDIHTLDNTLEKLMKLRGVNYFMKEEYKEKGFGDGIQIGVIAQEVEKVYPELVNTNEKTGYKAVDYSKFTPILIEAVKEQQEQIEALKKENNSFKAENTTVKQSVKQLEIENQELKQNYNQLKSELEQIKLMLNKQDLGTK